MFYEYLSIQLNTHTLARKLFCSSFWLQTPQSKANYNTNTNIYYCRLYNQYKLCKHKSAAFTNYFITRSCGPM